MSLRYRFYNRYPATETNETCLWHRVNHPVPMTSFSTGWNTNRYQGPLRRSLHPPPFPASSLRSHKILNYSLIHKLLN